MFPAPDLTRRRLAAVVAAALLIGLLPATVLAAGPVADDDHATVPVNAAATTIDVLDNDTGGPPLTIASATDPANGTVEVAVDGLSLTYQPDTDFHGTDTFDYTIDRRRRRRTTARSRSTSNSPPVAVDDPGPICQPGASSAAGSRSSRTTSTRRPRRLATSRGSGPAACCTTTPTRTATRSPGRS